MNGSPKHKISERQHYFGDFPLQTGETSRIKLIVNEIFATFELICFKIEIRSLINPRSDYQGVKTCRSKELGIDIHVNATEF